MATNGWINTLVQICFLRTTAEALPYTPKTTWGLTLGIVLVPLLLLMAQGPSAGSAGLGLYVIYALHTSAYLFFFYLMLRLRRLDERLTKLWLALMGSSLFIGLVNFVFIVIAPEMLRPLLLMFFGVWSFAVTLHIYCTGLEIGKIFAIGLMILLQLLSIFVSFSLLLMFLGGDPSALEQFLGGPAAAG